MAVKDAKARARFDIRIREQTGDHEIIVLLCRPASNVRRSTDT